MLPRGYAFPVSVKNVLARSETRVGHLERMVAHYRNPKPSEHKGLLNWRLGPVKIINPQSLMFNGRLLLPIISVEVTRPPPPPVEDDPIDPSFFAEVIEDRRKAAHKVTTNVQAGRCLKTSSETTAFRNG